MKIKEFLLKEQTLAIIISIGIYFIFFYSLWQPGNLIWGSDLEYKHFPSRWYLYKQIMEFGRFPFWTEKMFGGFPIYADSELGFLNPFNIISLVTFGPALSMKVMHFVSYLVGSLSLYRLIRKNGYGLISFTLSNLIYFFSFFIINHQIHFNLIMILYILPLNIFLMDKLIGNINTKQPKKIIQYIILNSLALGYGFYWGHYQTSLFVVMLMTFYSIGSIDIKKIRNGLYYFLSLFVIGISAIIISLPQTLPTADVYMNSERRASEEINLYEGSFSPSLITLAVFPQVWGTWETFYGKIFSEDYSYTEFYIYLGISVIILGSALFLLTKFSRSSKIFLLSYYSFIFFGFISFMPFITPDFIGLSGFRYWIRSVILVIFGLAYMSIKIEDLLKVDYKIRMKNIILKLLALLFPIVGLIILGLINPNKVVNFNLFDGLNYRNLLRTDMGYKWLLIGILTSLLIGVDYIKRNKKRISYLAAILIIVLVFIDLRLFGSDPLDVRIDKYAITPPAQIPEYLIDKRIIYNESLASGQRALYHNFWSPLGYSQFAPNDYADKFTSIDVDIISSRGEGFEDYQYVDELYELGVLGIYRDGEFLLSQEIPQVHYVKQGEFEAQNLLSEETGNYSFMVNTKKDETIQTFLKNDDGMDIKINGVQYMTDPEDTFIRVPVKEGLSLITIQYFPRWFYIGIVFTFAYLTVLFLIYKYVCYKGKDSINSLYD